MPGNFELIEAADALLAGRLGIAERLCRDCLRRDPGNVGAMRLLADVGMRLGRLDDAENLLTYCLELAPDFHLARQRYADLLFKRSRLRQALDEIDRVIRAEPDRPEHRLLKAAILAQMGAAHAAIPIYEELLAQHPDQPLFYLNLGHALRTVGRRADAVAAYRKSIELQPGLGEAYWSLANLKTIRFTEAEISRMRGRLTAGVTAGEDFVQLSFALGKALEDRGAYDESFRHYANGNSARRREVTWDAGMHHDNIERIAAFFGAEFFATRKNFGDPSHEPIFIVGLPRAGSTLLEQILSSHSRVEGTMELPDILSIVSRLGGASPRDSASRYPEVLADLDAGEFAALGAEYLERTAVYRCRAPHFIDKMPNNFAHIGLIRLILPNARIVDARRQPMACCFSVFKQLFVNGQTFSYSLEDIGRYYLDYIRLMSHWDSVLPGRVLRVDYEAVIRDTEAEVRRVLEHCGLEFEPACLEFHRSERPVRTPSSEQVRQPIYTSAVEQWRNYAAHLRPLAETLGMDPAS